MFETNYDRSVPDLEIRPQTVPQTIDSVFKIYLERFVPLITIVAVVTVPVLLLQGILNLGIIDTIESANVEDIRTFSDIWDLFAPSDVAATFALGMLGWLASALASGAVIVVVADAYLGRTTQWQDALRRALRHLGPLLIGSLLFGLGVATGFVLFIVPGLIVAIGWSVFGPAIVVENLGGAQGLGRAWDLTRGRRWPIFGAFLVIGIIVGIVGSIISSIFTSGTDYTMTNVIVDTAVNVLAGPLQAVTAGVLYIELRARNETFDRMLLSSELHRPEEPPSNIR